MQKDGKVGVIKLAKCIVCNKPTNGKSIANKPYCNDDYYKEFGDLIERFPIGVKKNGL